MWMPLLTATLEARDGPIVGALPPPPGVTPNFVNPVTRKHRVIVAAAICPIVSGAFFILRMYTRIRITRRLGWDDYTCIFAMLLAIAFSVVETELARNGLGTHQWDVPKAMYHGPYLKTRLTAFSLYWTLMCVVKLSILLLYLRLFTVSRAFRIMTWATGALVVAYSAAGFIGTLAACNPAKGTCKNISQLAACSSALNILTDLIIIVLPLPQVWRLQATLKQKLGLAVIFATGSFVCVVSVVRLYYYVIGLNIKDVTWSTLNGVIWTLIEGNTAIICACMPALRAFVQYHFPSILGRSTQVSASHPSSSKARHTITVTTTVSSSTKPWDSSRAAAGGTGVDDDAAIDADPFSRASYIELADKPSASLAGSHRSLPLPPPPPPPPPPPQASAGASAEIYGSVSPRQQPPTFPSAVIITHAEVDEDKVTKA